MRTFQGEEIDGQDFHLTHNSHGVPVIRPKGKMYYLVRLYHKDTGTLTEWRVWADHETEADRLAYDKFPDHYIESTWRVVYWSA